jgi:hypothetical protein
MARDGDRDGMVLEQLRKEGRLTELGREPQPPVVTRLPEYLARLESASTAAELEAAMQIPFKHLYHGRVWTRICAVRIRRGVEIVQAHPLGCYVPQFGRRRMLTVCGESMRVPRGGNSTGARYVWHGAGEWAMNILRREGFTISASHRMWDGGWNDYPHRCLSIAEAALAGRIPDPRLNVLRRHRRLYAGASPINYTVEQNDADDVDRRATRPCKCGGTLFDWGAGWSEGFSFINWHCNACPDVFTEYMTNERLYQLRNAQREARAHG